MIINICTQKVQTLRSFVQNNILLKLTMFMYMSKELLSFHVIIMRMITSTKQKGCFNIEYAEYSYMLMR